MKVITWVIENWDSIIVILVALAGLISAIVSGGKPKIIAMAKALCTEVEAKYGGGTGALKKAEVVSEIYSKLPELLKLIIPQSVLSKLIEIGLEEAKAMWEKNTAVKAIVAPEEPTIE